MIIPYIIRVVLRIIKAVKSPHFTYGRDGVFVDPINMIFIGADSQLQHAFSKIDWHRSEPVTIKSCIKMATAFILNKPYDMAPFRPLYIFGRKQDLGFQKSIGKSPRKRHHIRLWEVDGSQLLDLFGDDFFEVNKELVGLHKKIWIGASSEDMGIGHTTSYQVSHRINFNIDGERDYIANILKNSKCAEIIGVHDLGQLRKGKYVSDGRVVILKLK